MEFYSYLWLRENESPYYVGKGSGDRAFRKHQNGGRILYPPKEKSQIFIFPQDSEADAFESERALIWLFGRKDIGTGYLRNFTDGGENPPNAKGKRRSAATLQKMRAAQQGHRGNRGSKRSEATKDKMRLAQLGRTKGKPWTAARRAAGQPHRTPEEKAHLSVTMKAIRATKTWSGHPKPAF